MKHFTGKAAKILVLSGAVSLLLAANAFAADVAIGVGAVTGSSVRMRSEPTTSSSVITTLDKNVAVAVLDSGNSGWYQIAYAGNTGYLSADYLILDQDGVFTANGSVNTADVNVRTGPSTEDAVAATLPAETSVTVDGFQDGWYAVTCQYGTTGYIRSDFLDLTNAAASGAGADLVASAKQHLGTRYTYGGASSSGFDCSGFTMYVYGKYDVSLPHTATGQWQSGKGEKVWSIGALQPGDLVFFNDPRRNAGKACSHAGIYVGNGEFIHSSSSNSGGVIISQLLSGYYNTYFVGGLHIL